MDRRQLFRLIAAAGLAPALIRQVLANGTTTTGLRKVTGLVFVNGKPGVEGMAITPGDRVVTGPGSEAVYVIGQDAFLQRASSEVRFPMEISGFFRILTGRLLSVFGKGEKRLFLPTATIGIRGTACYIEAGTEKTYFCLCYGEAEVTPDVAPQQREIISTHHHDHPLYIHGDPSMPTSMVAAEVINHTDAELTMLESLVDRLPPFAGQNYTSY